MIYMKFHGHINLSCVIDFVLVNRNCHFKSADWCENVMATAERVTDVCRVESSLLR